MSLLDVARRLQETAAALNDTETLLKKAGDEIVRDVKANIDKSQTAGEFRPDMDTTGAPANAPQSPLAKYTRQRRRDRGVMHDHPLKDSGRLYREIGQRGSNPTRTIVGGTTYRARMLLRKHMGTDVSGVLSSDLERPIPYRNAMGYSRKVLSRVLSLFRNALGVDDNASGSANYEIRL